MRSIDCLTKNSVKLEPQWASHCLVMQTDDISDDEREELIRIDPEVDQILSDPERWTAEAPRVRETRKRRFNALFESLKDHSGYQDEECRRIDERCAKRHQSTFLAKMNQHPWALSTTDLYGLEDSQVYRHMAAERIDERREADGEFTHHGEFTHSVARWHSQEISDGSTAELVEIKRREQQNFIDCLRRESRTTFYHLSTLAMMDRGLIGSRKAPRKADAFQFWNWHTMWTPVLWRRNAEILQDFMIARPHHLIPKYLAGKELQKNLFCRHFRMTKKLRCAETWRAKARTQMDELYQRSKRDAGPDQHRLHENWCEPTSELKFWVFATPRAGTLEWHLKRECPRMADWRARNVFDIPYIKAQMISYRTLTYLLARKGECSLCKVCAPKVQLRDSETVHQAMPVEYIPLIHGPPCLLFAKNVVNPEWYKDASSMYQGTTWLFGDNQRWYGELSKPQQAWIDWFMKCKTPGRIYSATHYLQDGFTRKIHSYPIDFTSPLRDFHLRDRPELNTGLFFKNKLMQPRTRVGEMAQNLSEREVAKMYWKNDVKSRNDGDLYLQLHPSWFGTWTHTSMLDWGTADGIFYFDNPRWHDLWRYEQMDPDHLRIWQLDWDPSSDFHRWAIDLGDTRGSFAPRCEDVLHEELYEDNDSDVEELVRTKYLRPMTKRARNFYYLARKLHFPVRPQLFMVDPRWFIVKNKHMRHELWIDWPNVTQLVGA